MTLFEIDDSRGYENWDRLERKAKPFSEEARDRTVRSSGKFGLCHDCYHMALCQTDFNVRWAICTRFEEGSLYFRLDSAYPVTECNSYTRDDNKPSLHDMYKMATYIDPPRRQAGFLKEKE